MFEERILRHINHLLCCNFLLLRLFVDTALGLKLVKGGWGQHWVEELTRRRDFSMGVDAKVLYF